MTKSGITSKPHGMLPATGDIVLLPFPFTDQSGGKKRPVLVIAAPDGIGDFIAVPVTSQSGHDNTVDLQQPDLKDGTLPKRSWIKADKPVTLHTTLVLQRFGSVHTAVLDAVLTSLGKRLALKGVTP